MRIKYRHPSLDDETFKHKECFAKTVEELTAIREKRSQLQEIETNQTQQRRLRRQIKWLSRLIRQKNLFIQARKLRGAPENKEERINLFSRAFVSVAKSTMERQEFATMCRAAEELVDEQSAPMGTEYKRLYKIKHQKAG